MSSTDPPVGKTTLFYFSPNPFPSGQKSQLGASVALTPLLLPSSERPALPQATASQQQRLLYAGPYWGYSVW